jgi:hypothetical protein
MEIDFTLYIPWMYYTHIAFTCITDDSSHLHEPIVWILLYWLLFLLKLQNLCVWNCSTTKQY